MFIKIYKSKARLTWYWAVPVTAKTKKQLKENVAAVKVLNAMDTTLQQAAEQDDLRKTLIQYGITVGYIIGLANSDIITTDQAHELGAATQSKCNRYMEPIIAHCKLLDSNRLLCVINMIEGADI